MRIQSAFDQILNTAARHNRNRRAARLRFEAEEHVIMDLNLPDDAQPALRIREGQAYLRAAIYTSSAESTKSGVGQGVWICETPEPSHPHYCRSTCDEEM